MKKTHLVVSLLLFLNVVSFAQISNVQITVDGLTCSACSFTTQRSILELDFVGDVKMDLEAHVATVTFREGKKIALDKIAQKVVDAGFSVGSFNAAMSLEGVEISNDGKMVYKDDTYQIIGTKEKSFKGNTTMKFIGEKFMRKKDFKKWKDKIYKTTEKIYYITPD